MLKVIKSFKYAYRGIDVVEYFVGAEIADGDACETVALEEKWVKRVKDKAAPAADPDPDPPERPSGGALIADIVSKIDALDENEDYTQGGVPVVAALEKALGYNISASERDEAWAAWEEANPPAPDDPAADSAQGDRGT